MTFTVTERRLENFGSLNGALVEINVTSYTTNGEDVSGTGLGTGRDPVHIGVTAVNNPHIPRWDTTNKKLLLFDDDGNQLGSTTNAGRFRLFVLHAG